MTTAQERDLLSRPRVHCACGRAYTRTEWAGLRLRGVQPVLGWPSLELRDCLCGSTLSIEVPAEIEMKP